MTISTMPWTVMKPLWSTKTEQTHSIRTALPHLSFGLWGRGRGEVVWAVGVCLLLFGRVNPLAGPCCLHAAAGPLSCLLLQRLSATHLRQGLSSCIQR
jgi:hypothetical protein